MAIHSKRRAPEARLERMHKARRGLFGVRERLTAAAHISEAQAGSRLMRTRTRTHDSHAHMLSTSVERRVLT